MVTKYYKDGYGVQYKKVNATWHYKGTSGWNRISKKGNTTGIKLLNQGIDPIRGAKLTLTQTRRK